jgi:hypothetical protein
MTLSQWYSFSSLSAVLFSTVRCCALALLSAHGVLAQENLALSDTALLGLKDSLDSGPETEIGFSNSGTPQNINDGDLTTRVDTYNGGGPQKVSFAGIARQACRPGDR